MRRAELAPLGELHYGRKRVQPAGRLLGTFYDTARGVLKHDLLKLSASDIPLVADSLAEGSGGTPTPATPARFCPTTCTC